MSRTDHPRPRRYRGHRPTVRRVRMYSHDVTEQSVCTCGTVGPHRDTWAAANQDGRQHVAAALADAGARA